MNILFLVLCFFLIIYILFKKRRVDYYTIAAVSTVLYCYPAFFGKVLVNGQYLPLTSYVYMCLYSYTILLSAFIIIKDYREDRIIQSPIFESQRHSNVFNLPNNNGTALIIATIGLALMMYASSRYGRLLGTVFHKSDLMLNSNKLIEYYNYIATIVFAFAFISTGKYIKVVRLISLVLITYNFMLGYRVYAVLATIVISYHFVNKLSDNKRIRLIHLLMRHKVMTIAILFAGLFVMFFKGVFAALMAGRFDIVLGRLTNPNYYIAQFYNSESNSIMRNLLYTGEYSIEFSLKDYLLSFCSVIPFIGGRIHTISGSDYFEKTFNIQFNPLYYQGSGMGSTLLGEAFTAGSFPLMIVEISLIMVLVYYLNRVIDRTKDPFLYVWVSLLLVYLTFYSFRNSMINILIMGRAYLYITLMAMLLRKLRLGWAYHRNGAE